MIGSFLTSKYKIALVIVTLAVLWSGNSLTFAADQSNSEKGLSNKEYLDLASVLVRDGFFDRALSTLQEINFSEAKSESNFEELRYHTTLGIVQLNLGNGKAAKKSFQNALKHMKPEDKKQEAWIQFYLAKIAFDGEDYKTALKHLEKSNIESSPIPSPLLMKAQSHWNLGEKIFALATIESALKKFPDYKPYSYLKISWLMTLGLYEKAVEYAGLVEKRLDYDFQDTLTIAGMFNQHQEYNLSLDLLTRATLKFPQVKEIRAELASTYFRLGKDFTAANIFAELSSNDPSYASHAAELYKKVSQYSKALAYNSLVIDQKDKLRQRMAIYIELEDYDKVIALNTALARHSLDREDEVKYALSYSHFRLGNFDSAFAQLQGIEGGDIFDKANELRKVILSCKSQSTGCLF